MGFVFLSRKPGLFVCVFPSYITPRLPTSSNRKKPVVTGVPWHMEGLHTHLHPTPPPLSAKSPKCLSKSLEVTHTCSWMKLVSCSTTAADLFLFYRGLCPPDPATSAGYHWDPPAPRWGQNLSPRSKAAPQQGKVGQNLCSSVPRSARGDQSTATWTAQNFAVLTISAILSPT